MEAVGEVELVGDEEHPDAGFQEGSNDLAAYAEPSRIDRCERLIEQRDALQADPRAAAAQIWPRVGRQNRFRGWKVVCRAAQRARFGSTAASRSPA
jgi:hypothetical protein